MRMTGIAGSAALAAGIGLGFAIDPPVVPTVAAAGGATVAAIALGRRAPTAARIALVAALLLAGLGRAGGTGRFPPELLRRTPWLRELTGTVVSYPSVGSERISFVFDPDRLAGSLQVTWRDPARTLGAVHFGDRVQLSGTARLPEAFDGFDYPGYLRRRGIFARMDVRGPSGVALTGPSRGRLLPLGDRLRQTALARLESVLPSELFGAAQSLLFGDRTGLSPVVEDAFRRTGLMHLLAVSGLHLGILLAGVWAAVRALGVRPALAYPMVGVVVASALWIVGPRVSLVRAALLFAALGLGSVLADLGLILRRSICPMIALAVVAAGILLWRPGALLDAGFQLTIAATGAILAVFSRSGRAKAWIDRTGARSPLPTGLVRWTLNGLAASAAAQTGVAPVLALHFGFLYPWALVANLFAVPLATIALWSGLVAVLALPIAGAWVAAPFRWFLSALVQFVGVAASIPSAAIAVEAWIGWWVAGWIGLLWGTAWLVQSRSALDSWTRNSTSITSGDGGSAGLLSGRRRNG